MVAHCSRTRSPGTLPGLMAKVGLKGVRLHDLRHTHATLLLVEGVHLKVVPERLGHAGVRITGDLYSHVLPNLQGEAAVKLSEEFGAETRVDLQIGRDRELVDSFRA